MQYNTLISYIPKGLNQFQWVVTDEELKRIRAMFIRCADCRKTDLIRGESPEWLTETITIESICYAKDIRTNNLIIVRMDETGYSYHLYIGERQP